ncbi:MAG: LysM protein [Magnetococcales bacterium]|nr:LysM protein [Magnetococcales bacterium]HIJ82717.1 peptidoglycan DD-metalloendopeptidase family protein [Magnetococcales bacterium]
MKKTLGIPWIHLLVAPVLLLMGCMDSDRAAKVRIESGPPLAWGLEPTEKIKPTKSGVYVVQPGDTLWAIAAVHGVEVEDLAKTNHLQNPDRLWVGQRIVIKPTEGDDPATSARLEPPETSSSDIETGEIKALSPQPEPAPRTVAVNRVENIKEAGKKVELPAKEVERPTKDAEPPAKRGERPTKGIEPPAKGVELPTKGVEHSAKSAEPPVKSVERSTKSVELPPEPPASKSKAVANDVNEEEPVANPAWRLPVEAPKVWVWPHSGKVIGRFGKQGARQNNGIDIGVNEGDPVVASADGIVAYADDSLPGYGNLILLRHGGFFTTAYAHNEKILVKRGQAVRSGEKIALAGKSGGTKQPQVHFELRHHIKPLNPLQYLSKRN